MPRTAATVDLSIEDLRRLLHAREREIRVLLRRRSRIERKLGALDDRIAQIGGAGAGGVSFDRRMRRARNDVSLNEAIEKVLGRTKKPLSVGDIVAGVQSSGYRSTSKNFRAVVNQTLVKDKRFTSVSRGMYQMKV